MTYNVFGGTLNLLNLEFKPILIAKCNKDLLSDTQCRECNVTSPCCIVHSTTVWRTKWLTITLASYKWLQLLRKSKL